MRKNHFRIPLLFLAWLFSVEPVLHAGSLVAEPFRALNVKWEQHFCAGSDYWLLIDYPFFLLPGIKDEPFVRDSGVSGIHEYPMLQSPFKELSQGILRTVTLKSVTLTDRAGRTVEGAKFMVRPEERETDVIGSENLGKANGKSCIVTGDISDMFKSKTALPFVFEIGIPVDRNVEKVTIRHGTARGTARIGRIEADGVNLEVTDNNGLMTIKPASTVEGALRFRIFSEIPKFALAEFPEAVRGLLGKRPFTIRSLVRNPDGATRANLDPGVAALCAQYPETFLGYYYGEWDSNILNLFPHKSSLGYLQLVRFWGYEPKTPDDIIDCMKKNWDHHMSMYPKVWGLSVANMPHFSVECGSSMSGYELMGEHDDFSFRDGLMSARGAARQFDVPLLIYQAYYMGPYCPDSQRRILPESWRCGQGTGPGWGLAASESLRASMAAYYMGTNYQTFESQPWGQVERGPDGKLRLCANGKSVKELYEWTHSEKGQRGTCYTPIVMLADRRHGHEMIYRIRDNSVGHIKWGMWYNQFEPDDANYMTEYFFRSVSPLYEKYDYKNPKFCRNMVNSEIGDLFDFYVANPLTTGFVPVEKLAKYPVVMLIGDIEFSSLLKSTYREYVAGGGTLLLNSAHLDKWNEQDFSGVSPEGFMEDEGLKLRTFHRGKDTEVLLKTAKGTPLLISHRYGLGNVLVATPYWFKQDSMRPNGIPARLKEILLAVQSEVLPVQVKGDIQFLFNIMPDGTWKVILINNRGIVKIPWESEEKHYPEYTSEVQIVAPEGATTEEIRSNAPITTSSENGKTVFTLKVPPAEIMVVDLKLPSLANGKNFDLVGSWNGELAGDKAKDQSGNGHGMTLSHVTSKDGYLHFDAPKNHAATAFRTLSTIREGTYEFFVRPDLKKLSEAMKERKNRQCGLFYQHPVSIRLLDDSTWIFNLFLHQTDMNIAVPAKDNQWTHLAVTWSGCMCHFYVDGKEVMGETGPLKFDTPIGNDTFYREVNLVLGSLSPSWPWDSSFRGDVANFNFYSRAMPPAEVAKRSADMLAKHVDAPERGNAK